MFEEVENALFELEDLNEMLDLQNRQVDHRFQLTLYKENKDAELNYTRGNCNVQTEVFYIKTDKKIMNTIIA